MQARRSSSSRASGAVLQERNRVALPLALNNAGSAQQQIKTEEAGDERLQTALQTVKDLSTRAGRSDLALSRRLVDENFLRRTTKRRRASLQHDAEHARELLLSSPSKDANSSRLGGSDGSDPLEPAWDSFKAHPLALEDEEKATADYFRRLKMIQLEQETRNIFIHDTNDDTQTIYSSADVRRLEEEAREVKAQLQVRKRQMREERAAIERISAGAAVFDDLRNDVAEAQQLVAQIQDMEIELARLHVVQGASIGGADATKTPILGSFTRDEAEEILNNQLAAMEELETGQGSTVRAIEEAKKELAKSMQAVDRLNAERSAAEKMAREAKAAGEEQRDFKLEAVCRGYAATAALLQNLLGIVKVDAPSSNSLRAIYSVQDATARRCYEEIALLVRFGAVGDRISGYKLESKSGQDITSRLAPPVSATRSHLDRAVAANDASLLVHEALVCMEAAQPSDG